MTPQKNQNQNPTRKYSHANQWHNNTLINIIIHTRHSETHTQRRKYKHEKDTKKEAAPAWKVMFQIPVMKTGSELGLWVWGKAQERIQELGSKEAISGPKYWSNFKRRFLRLIWKAWKEGLWRKAKGRNIQIGTMAKELKAWLPCSFLSKVMMRKPPCSEEERRDRHKGRSWSSSASYWGSVSVMIGVQRRAILCM